MKFVANRITALAYTALLAFAANAQELWESAQAPGNVFVVKQFYTDTANDAMYAVGEVNVSGGNGGGNNSIMRYTSAGWDTLGHFDNMIFSIVTWHDTLIVGGGFEFVNGIPAISLAAYANGQWMPYGDIGYTSVFKLRILDNELYMVGSFEIADGHVSTGVAKRVGSEWVNVGIINDPYDKLLFDIAKYNGELIVTGIMAVPGENGGIMRYDGTNWHQLGSGLVGAGGQCLSVYKGELYVGGSFLIPQNIGQGIMRWNGSEWRNTGVGPQQINGSYQWNSTVLDMFVHNDLLWVAGYFRYASGVPAHFLATYDSLNWCGFAGEFPVVGAPQSIGLYHDTLYYSQSEVVLWGDTVNKILRFIGDTYSDTCGALQVGVGENFEPSGLLIRYSESEQTVHVDLPNGSSSRPITLFDALGKIHRRETGIHVAFSCKDRAPGIYVVRADGYAPVPVLVY